MKHLSNLYWVTLLGLLLGACASGPRYDTTRALPPQVTPEAAVPQMEAVGGRAVVWGGVILSSANLREGSQMELLGYPLSASQRPDASAPPVGRFLVRWPSYLETVDYAQGRLVTVSGVLGGVREGRVGESRYRYPVVTADGIYLWPRASAASEPRVHFGIGLMFHN